MKIGDLIKYKHRYIGEQFVVVGIRNFGKAAAVKCISAKTLKKTRWSCSSTVEVLA